MEEELDFTSLVTIHDLRGICMELLDITKGLPKEGTVQFRSRIALYTGSRYFQAF